MKTIAQVALPTGEIAERQSASRTYTHAVVVHDTPEARAIRVAAAQAKLAEAEAALVAAAARVKDEAAERAEADALKVKLDSGSSEIGWDAWTAMNSAYHKLPIVVRGSKEWEANRSRAALAQADRDLGAGVLQWSMSEGNAQKGAQAARKHAHHAGQRIEVVPTVQAEKAAKKAKRGVK